MTCKWCNSEVQENAKFCTNCGGSLVDSSAETNINQNSNVQNQSTTNVSNEKANIGLVILSFLIPLAGLIIFLVKKDDDKKTAKTSGIAALISFGISFVFTIIMVIIITFSIGKSVNGAINGAIDLSEDIIDQTQKQIEEDKKTETNDTIESNSEWQKYEFIVNNKTFKLPSTYSELSNATSSVIQTSYIKSYLQSGYYSLLNMYKDDKLSLYIEVLNDTDLDQLYTDCKITRISQTKYQSSVGAEVITFPGNLKVGQEITKEEIINLLGTPSDIKNYTSDGYINDIYSYYEDTIYTTTNYYKISVVNGIIDELTLDHRSYN